jgi:hypothetical protein
MSVCMVYGCMVYECMVYECFFVLSPVAGEHTGVDSGVRGASEAVRLEHVGGASSSAASAHLRHVARTVFRR